MKPLLRFAYGIAARLRVVYWFVFRPKTKGVKCLVQYNDQWLMIRNSYGTGQWTFPGGAIARHETPEDAAIREVHEEVGIALENVQPIGFYQSNRQYKHDTVYCFIARVSQPDHHVDEVEVIASGWFAPAQLPSNRGKAVDQVVKLLASA